MSLGSVSVSVSDARAKFERLSSTEDLTKKRETRSLSSSPVAKPRKPSTEDAQNSLKKTAPLKKHHDSAGERKPTPAQRIIEDSSTKEKGLKKSNSSIEGRNPRRPPPSVPPQQASKTDSTTGQRGPVALTKAQSFAAVSKHKRAAPPRPSHSPAATAKVNSSAPKRESGLKISRSASDAQLLENQRSSFIEDSEAVKSGSISSKKKSSKISSSSTALSKTSPAHSSDGSVVSEKDSPVHRLGSSASVKNKDVLLSLAEGNQMSAETLRSVLDKQLAYASGGLENDVHPILTIPDRGLRQLADSSATMPELDTTLLYLKKLLRADQVSAGVTLLLDARSSKTHPAVKQLLERLVTEEHPLLVHVIYIFVKTGLFGRSKTFASTEVTSKLHLAYLSDQKALLDQFERSNVTSDLGGTLVYNHKHWVHNRIEFERMQKLYHKAVTRFPEVMQALDLCSVPESVKDAEHLMQEDLKLKEGLINRLAEAELQIDNLLDKLKAQHPDSVEMTPGTKDYITMVASLNGMLEELRQKQNQFDTFWAVHKARVDHMMRMCHFNRGAEKLHHLMQGHIEDLTARDVVLGDTLESALELGEKHEAFVKKCTSTIDDHMAKIREDAKVLLDPQFDPGHQKESEMHSATKQVVETIRTKVKELADSYQKLISISQEKRDLFIVCVKFHMTTRQCQQWNQEVLEYLAAQPIEEPNRQTAERLLDHLDGYLSSFQLDHLTTLRELSNSLPERPFKKTLTKIEQKYEQSRDLLNNRKVGLLKILASAYSPVPTPKSGHNTPDQPNGEPPGNHHLEVGVASSPKPHPPDAPNESVDGEPTAAMLKARQFVYRELVQTEADYLKDIKTVIDSYYDDMDPENLSIPLRLRGKREAVFGNLLDIYKFHDSVFSKSLERYADCPQKIGECFLQFTTEFQMYSLYCKNRASSETLVTESTESQTFFKGIQMKLGHQLPLNAYLLKPVQRITKYQLLLKDMMKQSVTEKLVHSQLKAALDRMLKLLKNLNDSLHVVGLKGFPGSLAEQGRLLVHDAFHAWQSHGRFSKKKEQHVFLFEKVVILSKKIEAQSQKRAEKKICYLYKDHLQIAELSLREIDGQKLQFELSVHGQNKYFKFQAPTVEVKEMWVSEIRRLLQLQFTLMKDMVIKSGTLDRRTYKGKAKLSTQTRTASVFDSAPHESLSVKKSLSSRFRILKRRKPGEPKKKAFLGAGVQGPDASLIASCSLPASIIFSVKSDGGGGGGGGGGSGNPNLSLSQSMGSNEGDDGSVSSDEDFQFSDDDDASEMSIGHYESLAPGAPRYYTAIGNYNPGSDEHGVALSEEQEVEVLGINQFGWWWVRSTNYSSGEVEEGWVPASYLRVSSVAVSEV